MKRKREREQERNRKGLVPLPELEPDGEHSRELRRTPKPELTAPEKAEAWEQRAATKKHFYLVSWLGDRAG
jgi:hypothetical protein